MKLLRAARLGSNFSGSYKKECSILAKVAYNAVAETFMS